MLKTLLLWLVLFADVLVPLGCSSATSQFDNSADELNAPDSLTEPNGKIPDSLNEAAPPAEDEQTIPTLDSGDSDIELEKEKKWLKMGDASINRWMERVTAPYRIPTSHSKAKLRQLWHQLSQSNICLHGGSYFSWEGKYAPAKMLIFNIDAGILDFLALKLASGKPTKVHTSAGVDGDASESELAWLLLAKRTQSEIFNYDGDDPLIRQSLAEWKQAVEDGTTALGYLFADIQSKIVSNKESRKALVSFFRKQQKEHPIKEVEVDFGGGLIPLPKLRESEEQLKKMRFQLPVLPKNTEASCPLSKEEIHAYLLAQFLVEEESTPKNLKFLRTAKVATDNYWIWETNYEDIQIIVWAIQPQKGEPFIGFAENEEKRTLEQIVVGDYFGF